VIKTRTIITTQRTRKQHVIFDRSLVETAVKTLIATVQRQQHERDIWNVRFASFANSTLLSSTSSGKSTSLTNDTVPVGVEPTALWTNQNIYPTPSVHVLQRKYPRAVETSSSTRNVSTFVNPVKNSTDMSLASHNDVQTTIRVSNAPQQKSLWLWQCIALS